MKTKSNASAKRSRHAKGIAQPKRVKRKTTAAKTDVLSLTGDTAAPW
jgi:hypothetical protein